MQLDKTLFLTIMSMVKGSSLSLLQDLKGKNARYTFAIIALWKHAELGSSSRRLNAMTDMQFLMFNGEAGKWKIDLMKNAREVCASGLTIEHFIMHCAIKSFEGKNQQVHGMMANDINNLNTKKTIEEMASEYSSFIATLNSGKESGKGMHAALDAGSCNYCEKVGHTEAECR